MNFQSQKNRLDLDQQISQIIDKGEMLSEIDVKNLCDKVNKWTHIYYFI